MCLAQLAHRGRKLRQRRRLIGQHLLQGRDQTLQSRRLDVGDLCLAVGNRGLRIADRQRNVVGIDLSLGDGETQHRDAHRIHRAGQTQRLEQTVGLVGERHIDRTDVEAGRGAERLALGARNAQTIDGTGDRREGFPVGPKRIHQRAAASGNRRQASELLVDLIKGLAKAVDRLHGAVAVAEIARADEFLDGDVRREQRGMHPRHAGITVGAGDELADGAADLGQPQHGEQRQHAEETQDQREAAEDARADADTRQKQ